MGIGKFIQRNLSSFQRSRNKKEAIQSVLRNEQKENGVVNIHRIDMNNVGDYYCAPHLYFDQLKNTGLDIFDFKSQDAEIRKNWVDKITDNALIVGGGGLLNRSSFAMQMKLFEALAHKGKTVILWGAGHNEKDASRFGKVDKYNVDISAFSLAGTRDLGMTEEWLPCVSCMHEIFDRNYTSEQELGIIFHKKTMKKKNLLSELKDIPSTSNTTNLEEMINFIGKSETIVTDSYHAMYWSMLLGKKVAVVPNSSKFFSFKYQPIYTTFESIRTDYKEAPSFPGILEECRSLNLNFAEKVFDHLNL